MKQTLRVNEKLKVPILMAALGVGLMLIFPKEHETPAFSVDAEQQTELEAGIDRQISDILSCVDGAGAVKVMLTLRSNGVTEYQTDREESNRNGETVVKSTTVFGGNTAKSALVIRRTAAEYMGAVIVAEGADSAEVRYGLSKAMSALTGLPINKITVLKMK